MPLPVSSNDRATRAGWRLVRGPGGAGVDTADDRRQACPDVRVDRRGLSRILSSVVGEILDVPPATCFAIVPAALAAVLAAATGTIAGHCASPAVVQEAADESGRTVLADVAVRPAASVATAGIAAEPDRVLRHSCSPIAARRFGAVLVAPAVTDPTAD